MEGYDIGLLGNFYAYPSFRQKYGQYFNEESGYQITAEWQIKFNCLSAFANILGAFLNGWATARWSHRKVLMGGLVALTCFTFISLFFPNINVLLLGQLLCNIPWGIFATTGPSHAAEVTPLAIRGYLAAYVNLCWCIGQFISAGVLKGLVSNTTQWGYMLEIEERAGVTYWDAFRGTDRRRTGIACMSFLSQITNGGALCYSGSFFFLQTGISASASFGISLGGTNVAFCGTIVSWFLHQQTKPLAWTQSLLCAVWLGACSMSVGPIVYTIVAEVGSTRLRT
ncbi:hypothetical protein B0H63DRAFT_558059 [Podospora didyma]|uniref:Major facilitator superfamily (MFS) profile domain-containing protein n=1 Tax=Podospora didyma TaxID=330526 RepID=A0AAE0P0U4_9PEZI|nr:hypothetical protein B0H63DRAFT_558059 [Podospora didyma]